MKKALLLAPMSSVHERFNKAAFLALKDLGYQIEVAANFSLNEHDLDYKKTLNNDGIPTYDVPFQRHSLLKNLGMIPSIKKILQAGQYDIVHCHTETGGLLTRLAMSADRNAKYLYTPHGMSFYKGSSVLSQVIYRPIEHWICTQMDAVIAMNKEEMEVLTKWNEKTAYYIHGTGLDINSVNSAKENSQTIRKELGIPEDAFVVLSVGELNDNKNHQVIIEALSKIDNSNIYYVICGEGDVKERLLMLAKQYNLQERLILTGYRYDVKAFYHMADLFAFPSFHEGLPVAVMESMEAGLPVVCSKIRGNVDLIENEKGGYCVDGNDATEYARRIFEFYGNKILQNQFGKYNCESVLKFSVDAVYQEMNDIYQEMTITKLEDR